jgi:hypothetical protein
MKAKKYEIHPMALIYPPMSDDELDALTDDIRERGLMRPIVRHEGKILDGRNRYAACLRCGVEPTFIDYEGDDPLGQVNSLNLNRDLNGAQRAIVAARQLTLNGEAGHGGKRFKSSGGIWTIENMARKFRVGKDSISQARDIVKEAPDLADLIGLRSLSLTEAMEQLEERRAETARKEREAAIIARFSPELIEAVADGRLTQDQAIAQMLEREREAKEELRRETEGRQLWFEALEEVIDWAQKRVAGSDDANLAWYTDPALPDTGHHITREQIEFVKTQLDRIITITLAGARNGRQRPKRGTAAQRAAAINDLLR